VDLHARGEERFDPRRDRGRVEAADVEADEADRRELAHGIGRDRVDGCKDVAERGEAADGGDDLVMDRGRGLDLQDDAVGRDRQEVKAQQQRRRDREVGGMVRRDQVEVDVGERLQQGAGAEARGCGRGLGVAGQDLVADDRARRVAHGLAHADDAGRPAVRRGDGNLDSHPRNHRPKAPEVDPTAATLNAWASSTVR
jgi:hypothetical protein